MTRHQIVSLFTMIWRTRRIRLIQRRFGVSSSTEEKKKTEREREREREMDLSIYPSRSISIYLSIKSLGAPHPKKLSCRHASPCGRSAKRKWKGLPLSLSLSSSSRLPSTSTFPSAHQTHPGVIPEQNRTHKRVCSENPKV